MNTSVMAVANEVRANLARQRMSGRQAADKLGWRPEYMQRRLAGKVAFDVADLSALARLLDVPVTSFFSVPPVRTSSGKRFFLIRGPKSAFSGSHPGLLGCAA
jgi:transcriptional regulator with XRE-family HTH domain